MEKIYKYIVLGILSILEILGTIIFAIAIAKFNVLMAIVGIIAVAISMIVKYPIKRDKQ